MKQSANENFYIQEKLKQLGVSRCGTRNAGGETKKLNQKFSARISCRAATWRTETGTDRTDLHACDSRRTEQNVKIKIWKIIVLPVVLHGHETWCFT
jgi:hypothetical protein